jgi:hypothetical protein
MKKYLFLISVVLLVILLGTYLIPHPVENYEVLAEIAYYSRSDYYPTGDSLFVVKLDNGELVRVNAIGGVTVVSPEVDCIHQLTGRVFILGTLEKDGTITAKYIQQW